DKNSGLSQSDRGRCNRRSLVLYYTLAGDRARSNGSCWNPGKQYCLKTSDSGMSSRWPEPIHQRWLLVTVRLENGGIIETTAASRSSILADSSSALGGLSVEIQTDGELSTPESSFRVGLGARQL